MADGGVVRQCAGEVRPRRARLSSVRAPRALGKLLEGIKEDKMAPSYPDHGGLSSGEVTPMAVTAEVAKAPLPRLKRLG